MISLVLLVEDQPDLAELWLELLESRGWTPRLATRLAEVGPALGAELPALAIVDWTLPDGVAESLVIRLSAAGVRVIVTTGHGDGVAAAARAAGAVRVLQKPFNLRTLIDAIGPLTAPTDSPR